MTKEIVVELGCGTPNQRKGNIGIDINPENKPDIVADLNKGIPLQDHYVDKIIIHHTLEHLENPSFVLREIKRVLKNEGIVEITIPNAWWLPLRLMLFTDVNKLWRHKFGFKPHWLAKLFGNLDAKRTGHLTHWSKDILKMYLELNGFEVVGGKGHHMFGREISLIGRCKNG